MLDKYITERDHKGNVENLRRGIGPERMSHVSQMNWEKAKRMEFFGNLALKFIKDELRNSKYGKECNFYVDYEEHYYSYGETPNLVIAIKYVGLETAKTEQRKSILSGVKSFIKSNIGLDKPKEKSTNNNFRWSDGWGDTTRNGTYKVTELIYKDNWLDQLAKNENFSRLYQEYVDKIERNRMAKAEEGLNFADEFRSTWANVKISDVDRKKMETYFAKYTEIKETGEKQGRYSNRISNDLSSYVRKCLHSIKTLDKYLARIKIAKELGWNQWVSYAIEFHELKKFFDNEEEIRAVQYVINHKVDESLIPKKGEMNLYEAKHKLRMAGYILIKED